MDSDSYFQIIIMLICLAFSSYFSATETAFTSFNRLSIKALAENGNNKAQRVMNLSEKYDKLLSTILVGNNIVNITLASVGTLFFIDNVSKNFGATIASIVITIVVLIFGEITPKNLAKDNAELFAMSVSSSISFFVVILSPINYIFSLWKKLISKLFKTKRMSFATENEILTLVDEAELEGEFDSEESDLIRSAVEFNDLDVFDIYTPRVDITGIENGATNSEIAKTFIQSGHSRLPVFEDSMDNIVGIINQKDFYNQVYNHSTPVSEIIKDPLYITGSMKISDLLHDLQKVHQHIAVVVDEYGGTLGIVTMEDILEELVGEIFDEHDDVVTEITEVDENRCRVMCSMDFDEFCDHFLIEDETEMNSVGGWVMEKLGKIPKIGDSFEFEDYIITVIQTDEKRVEQIEMLKTHLETEENIDED